MGDLLNPKKTAAKTGTPTYSSYLKIDELVSLQQPLSEPLAHDEMLFIITHQTYELWFKQVIFEMRALIELLDKDTLIQSYRILERVREIFRVLVQQIDILETMSPVDFNRFRSRINPASGFQSVQFRELELLAGASPAQYGRLSELDPEWKARLAERGTEPNLRDAFFNLLRRSNLLTSLEPAAIIKALVEIYYRAEHSALHKLCETLLSFDEQFSLWRFRHVQMVERMIGMKSGTGGSLGVSYLAQTLKKRFFQELWEVRTQME